MQVQDAGTLNRIAKAMAPPMSRLTGGRRIGEGVRLLEIYLEILQGRGAGTGWDLRGEAVAARRFLRGVTDPVVFDVGANAGQWAARTQAELGAGRGRLYLFEPQSACHAVLVARAAPNHVVVPKAVGDQLGTVTLFADAPGSGLASLNRRRDSYFGDMTAHQESVALTTVDHEMAELGVGRVDLLKLDVEGGEMAALRGAESALRAGAITTIAFEFGSGNVYSRTFFRDFWDLLTPLGYRLWRIRPGGATTPVPAYTEELEHFRGVSNYLASLASPSHADR